MNYCKFVPESINGNDELHYETAREIYKYDPTFNLQCKDKDYILDNDFIFSAFDEEPYPPPSMNTG